LTFTIAASNIPASIPPNAINVTAGGSGTTTHPVDRQTHRHVANTKLSRQLGFERILHGERNGTGYVTMLQQIASISGKRLVQSHEDRTAASRTWNATPVRRLPSMDWIVQMVALTPAQLRDRRRDAKCVITHLMVA